MKAENKFHKGIEEATSKNIGRVETWFRGEMNHGYCRGEGAMVSEKGEREREAQRRMYRMNIFQKQLAWKIELAKFLELLQ